MPSLHKRMAFPRATQRFDFYDVGAQVAQVLRSRRTQKKLRKTDDTYALQNFKCSHPGTVPTLPSVSALAEPALLQGTKGILQALLPSR